MRRFGLCVLSCGSVLAMYGAAHAQSADSGALAGIVTDANGAVVPDAALTATNTGTAQAFTARSNGRGEFRIPQLPPGSYSLKVSIAGFKTYEDAKVTVEVGVIQNISPKLEIGAVTETVEVSNESPLMHTESSEISSVIDQNMIDDLPINGRRASNFALLTPGVVSNGDGFGLLSFRGISFLLNNSTIDGMDDNQAYFSEQRGRTRAAYSISQTAIQEFQVNTSNFSAEYGRSAGGVINTVTRSGGNQFHGQLFFYDRDNDFGASNPYTVLTSYQNGTGNYITTNYKPKDWRKQWGFGVGGPIIHDKLFFFYSYDQSRRNFPGTAVASTATAGTFAPADATLAQASSYGAPETCTAGAGSNVTTTMTGDYGVCALAYGLNLGQTAAAYQQAYAYYSQGLGILASFLGPVPRSSDQVINFPKLDYQINERNHLVLEATRLRASSPNGIQTQQSNTYGRGSFGNDFIKEDFEIARLATTINSTMVNELRFQYGRDFEYGSASTPTGNELPLANNQYGVPPDISIGYDYDAQGFDIGNPPTLQRRALPNERRIQAADGYTWSHGKNVTKAGLDFNRVYDFIDNLYNETGTYSEDNGPAFLEDYYHATKNLGGSTFSNYPGYYQFSQGFGTRQGNIATTDYAGYITNDWRATSRLTLTTGLRYEYEYIPPNPYANTTGISGPYMGSLFTLTSPIPQSADRPDDRNNIQPRVGFSLDVYGNGKTFLRGGYGYYNGRIINSNILQVYLNSGSPYGQLNLKSVSSTRCAAPNQLNFPSIFPSGIAGALQFAEQCGATTSKVAGVTTYNAGVQTTVAYLDPHLQNPQVQEIDLAIEQNLGHQTVFSLSYLSSLGRELASAVDRNLAFNGTTNENYIAVNSQTLPNQGYQPPLPRGGVKAPPIPVGQSVNLKTYTGAGVRNTNGLNGVYQILDFKSDVNSSYNALSAQITHRFSQSFGFMAHYTWSHALDYNPYLSTADGTDQQLDPNNLSQEYGNSILNVRNRFVFSGSYRTGFHYGNRLERQLANGWQTAVIVQAQTGLPFSAMTAKTAANASYSGIIGAGGINRLPKFDATGGLLSARNAYTMPDLATVDLRLSRSFTFDDRLGHFRLEFLGEAFNLLNHQNITQVNTNAYTVCSAPPGQNFVDPRLVVGSSNCPTNSGAIPTGSTNPQYYLLYNPYFGTNRNSNSNATYTPRQLEGSIRLFF